VRCARLGEAGDEVKRGVDDAPREVAADGADEHRAHIFAAGSATLIAQVNDSTMMRPKTISEKRSSGSRTRLLEGAGSWFAAASF
jgi:hypothetical protein